MLTVVIGLCNACLMSYNTTDVFVEIGFIVFKLPCSHERVAVIFELLSLSLFRWLRLRSCINLLMKICLN